ncbi:phage minor tail protein L domain protein [Escherichia coli STEC_S1191]|nr:phage minor tail protein L domain protein [Escherichia coli STEC_S1191]
MVLWEIDLTEVGGERYFFCNEQNEKGEPVGDALYAGMERADADVRAGPTIR